VADKGFDCADSIHMTRDSENTPQLEIKIHSGSLWRCAKVTASYRRKMTLLFANRNATIN